jgi:hypothetical protein
MLRVWTTAVVPEVRLFRSWRDVLTIPIASIQRQKCGADNSFDCVPARGELLVDASGDIPPKPGSSS